MAPLPVESTGRYFVDYSCGTEEHTALIRANAIVSPAGIGTIINAIFTAAEPLMWQMTINRVRWSASGSVVSNPVTSGFEGTTYGSDAPTEEAIPRFMDFVGRSQGGRRARFALFSYKDAVSGYRLTSSENAQIAAIVTLLNSSPNAFLSIDGMKPVWYPYADVGWNAYWQRAIRA